MALNKLHTSQISNTSATDGQVLQYVAANTRVEFVTLLQGEDTLNVTFTPSVKHARLSMSGNESLTSSSWQKVDNLTVLDVDTSAGNALSDASNAKLTVPAGVSKVRLTASIDTSDISSQIIAEIYHYNSSDALQTTRTAKNDTESSGNDTTIAYTSIVNVSEGDYFELYAFGSDAGTLLATKYTYLEMEVLEGSLLNSTVGSAISESALANVGIASAGGLTGANTNINTVQGNAAAFASYANSTFGTSADPIQSNLAAFASYANSTFGTSADPIQSNLTAFGTYANSTFSTHTLVTANINSVVHGITGANTNIGSAVHGITGANATITANKTILNTFGTYANSTFASGNIGLVQSNLDAYSTYANSNFLTTAAANVGASTYPVDATTNAFTMTQSVSNVNNILVFMDGLVQSPDTYVVSGTTLTISNSSPLPAGVNVDVRYLQFVFPGEIDGGDI